MKKIHLTQIIAVAAGLVAAVSLLPQAYAEPSAQPDTPQVQVNVKGDGGVEAIQKAQAAPDGEHYKAGMTAQALVESWLKEDGYSLGEMDSKGRLFAMGVGEFNTEEPSIDPQKFCLDREVALERALLDARAQIIEYANSKMDVLMQAETPGTDLNAEFGDKQKTLMLRLEAQQKTVADLLAEVDKSQSEELAGVTAGDRANALMDAAIKKLDSTYSVQKIDDEKRQKLETAKKRYEDSTAELAKINDEIKKTANSVTRSFHTKISKLAKMPLFGSTCIYQTESWDAKNEKYTVAVAVVWSVGLEKATRGIIQGQDVVLDAPKKGTTLNQWLEGQDLGAMIGPRTFMDEKGQRHFLGISAVPIASRGSQMEKNREVARMQADSVAVLSLRSDVEVAKTAEEMSQTITTDDQKEEEKSMASLTQTIRAELRGQNINGLGRVYETEVNHALTGIKMLVTISGIDPEAVKAARTAEEVNYAAAIAGNKENSRLQGRKDQLEESKAASVNDQASYSQGRKDAANSLKKQADDRQAAQKEKAQQSQQAQAQTNNEPQQDQTLDGAVGSKPKNTDDGF